VLKESGLDWGRDEAEFQREWRNLLRFGFLESSRWTFLRAASLYRFLRRKGVTVNSFDTTIAAVCLENALPLLTLNRRDFEPIARHIVLCDGDGVTSSDLRLFTYRNRRRPLFPFERD